MFSFEPKGLFFSKRKGALQHLSEHSKVCTHMCGAVSSYHDLNRLTYKVCCAACHAWVSSRFDTFPPSKFVSVRPQLTLASNGQGDFDIVWSIIILACFQAGWTELPHSGGETMGFSPWQTSFPYYNNKGK